MTQIIESKRTRFSDVELADFKKIILDKIENAEKQISFYLGVGTNKNSGDDTGKAHKPFEESSSDASRKDNDDTALRQEKLIRDLKNALIRIENKTYGRCRISGNLINPQRLRLVPHATLSIDAKNALQMQKQ